MKPLKFTTLLVILSLTSSAQDIKRLAATHIQENGHRIIADFGALLSMPNVAYDLPNINRNADYLKTELEKRGVQARLLRMIGTPPIVFGYLPAKNATTTLAFYVHYDGQPVDTTQWTHSPWKPTYYDKAMWDGGKPIPFPKKGEAIDPENRIYARSAGDDKAPII